MNNSFNLKKMSLFALLVLSGATIFGMEPAAPMLRLQMRYDIVPRALDAATINEIEQTIDYRFKNKGLLIQALTKSNNSAQNYERFEYFGDSILNAIIDEILLREYPTANPGKLTDANSELTRQEALAALCLQLRLHQYIQTAGANIPISSLCDVIESLIAAIYKDGGKKEVEKFVLKFFMPMIKNKECPTIRAKIIRKAAKQLKKNIEYAWVGMDLCGLSVNNGNGIFTQQFKPTCNDTKKDANRLACYLAERDFIIRALPINYQKSLVRLATDPDYQPLSKAPTVNLSWKEGMHSSSQERLHTVMQKLGLIPTSYKFQEEDEGDSRFTCTLEHPLFKGISSIASTKNAAAESAADSAYKALQASIIFSEDIALILGATNQLNAHDPANSLNAFCQTHNLTMPTYTTEENSKNGIYAIVTAPWLHIVIKGQSKSVAELAITEAAKKVIVLLKHLSTHYIEPKKLETLVKYKQIEPTGSLIHLCRCFGLEEPTKETYYCEGLVTEPLQFKTIITMTDSRAIKKAITGLKARSAIEAQNNAARKASLRMINKMLKKEIQP